MRLDITPSITRQIYSAALVFFLVAATALAAEPFGPTDFDQVHSDTASVHYEVSRDCLADQATCLGNPALSSVCRTIDSIVGQRCNTGIHRFCTAKGHASGYGTQNASDPNLVDITCTTSAATQVFSPSHADLAAQHGGCTNGLPSLSCSVAIDRYCRLQPGNRVGFGPVERNASIAVVSCLTQDASRAITPLRSEVEAQVPGCNLSLGTVSTACRQAMDLQCRAEDSDLRGGFGPGELGLSVYMGCVENRLPWMANTQLPDSPALPVDLLDHQIDPNSLSTLGYPSLSSDHVHNALAASRSLSFDGRLMLKYDAVHSPDVLRFLVQTPEIFDQPLSQSPTPNKDRSYERGFFADYYASSIPHTALYNSTVGTFEGGSSAICDPHQGTGGLNQANRQQSVPDRVSNPYACAAPNSASAVLDHDCYDVTVVTVFDTGNQDELWGTPVTVVVANPKGAAAFNGAYSSERARVVDVQVGTPVKSPFPAGEPRQILEPNITGDGRLLVIQGDGMIQYSVMPESATPCDVTQWSTFEDLYEMHTDPLMADYGIARYPIRDPEGNVLSTSVPGDHRVRAAYPWIDRDGDNMMFMLGAATLFYVDGNGAIQQKFPVTDHPSYPTGQTPDDIPCGTNCTRPFLPDTPQEVDLLTDHLPRVGLTFVGLWSQGKMFSPDTRNNAVDFGVEFHAAYHRDLHLYADRPEGTEVGGSIRTSINSPENQFFFHPELRPDTPREVVWNLSTQAQTDEVAFDDVIEPRALIVSTMTASIKTGGGNQGRFQDGFVYTGREDGEGFQFPAHVANSATSVSEEVADLAAIDLSANVQWNPPSSGYLLGGARVEPIAAGGAKGKGLWLDGADDRLEYIVPPQPANRQTEMVSGAWFFTLSIDPRELSTSRRLLTLPDGTWLDVESATTLRFGKSGTYTVDIPPALALTPNVWSTLSIVSAPDWLGFEIRIYLDGYLLSTYNPTETLFRVEPGLVTLGSTSTGFRGWIDDFKVIANEPNVEVICNHARGTLVGVETGDPLDALAAEYPITSHQAIASLLSTPHVFPRYACERPIANPVDIHDQADHSNYTCLGQTRRLNDHPDQDKCVKHPLLFAEGPLKHDLPRPSSASNAFCISCHIDSHPSVTMRATEALSPAVPPVDMPDDIRRQPMQNSPKFFGNIPAFFFGTEPALPIMTPVEGVPLDPYTTPSDSDP